MKTIKYVLITFHLIPFFILYGGDLPAGEGDSLLLKNLHTMRLRQQDEEMVVRAQVFKTVQTEERCTPVQQVRQRLKDLKKGNNETEDDIVINAGHEELNVTDNHGTIDSDINVQIIKQGGEKECL